jgi:hypothetical protein
LRSSIGTAVPFCHCELIAHHRKTCLRINIQLKPIAVSNLCLAAKSDRKGAIKTIAKWEHFSLAVGAHEWEFAKRALDQPFIFLRLKTTGAINKTAAGLQEREHGAENPQLLARQTLEVFSP